LWPRVVHELEVVEVQEHDGDGQPVTPGSSQGQRQRFLEHGPVGEPGQAIVVREEPDLLLRLFAVGDVDHHALPEPGQPVVVPDEHRLVTDPDGPALAGHEPVLLDERLAALVGAQVLRQHTLAVVRVQELHPQVGVGGPGLRGIAQDGFDLRAHVQG
jgi:hypothetical protein